MIPRLVAGALCSGAGWWASQKGSTLTVALIAGAVVVFIADLVAEAGRRPPGGGGNSTLRFGT